MIAGVAAGGGVAPTAAAASPTSSRTVVLRVTHLFRREDGEWRLIHRHADALASVIPPAAMLQDAAEGAG